MSGPLVELRREGTTAVLTFRREAKLNAISTAVERELDAALDHPDVQGARCVVITGGEKVFSAGADVGEMRDMDPASVLAYYRETGRVYDRVARLPQPTIAAIAGYCIGGGLELASAMDFRVADVGATFGLPEVAIGIVPSSGGTLRLTRLLGTARAKELILLGERFRAERAAAVGLLTEIAPAGQALPRALALAERLAAQPPLAASVAKQLVDAVPEASGEAVLALERLAYAALAQTDEHAEATRAFMDRRSS
jgi:enoyl-CoA hydratase/carnithine racemase